MPPIRFTALECRTLLTVSISLNGKIISPYSRCAKKGLVYIAITAPSSRQPFFCLECTKANTCSLCDMRSVSVNKYTFLCCWARPCAHCSLLVPYLRCRRVSGSHVVSSYPVHLTSYHLTLSTSW